MESQHGVGFVDRDNHPGLDEIAIWDTDETSAEPDVEVINAIKPGMATVKLQAKCDMLAQ
jgi:hypothetical protein